MALPDEKLGLDQTVRYGKLENGFTYYIKDNDSPITALFTVVKAGIYHEDKDQLEYAHLMEHMGAKGTKNFPNIRDIFGTTELYSHAHTSYDVTYYYAHVPSEKESLLKTGLQLLRDWAQNISIEQESIDVERGAILGEMRGYNSYQNWLRETITKEVFKNTGISPSVREEHAESIRNFNRKAFERFYKNWYRPDLEAAIIVGDVNVDSLEVEVKNLFSDLKMPSHPENASEALRVQTVKLKGKNQYVIIPDSIKEGLKLFIFSKRLNNKYGLETRSDYKNLLLQDLYKKIVSERSKILLQQYDAPFSQYIPTFNNNASSNGKINLSEMEVALTTKDTNELKKKFIRVVRAWNSMNANFSEKELKNAKAEVIKDLAFNSMNASRDLAIKYMDHFVKGTSAIDPKEESRMISQLLSEIKLVDIQEFAINFSNLKRNTDFLLLKGKGEPMLKKQEIIHWLGQANALGVYAIPEPERRISSLEEFVPRPKEELEVKETSEDLIGLRTIELENGIKLILKPTKPRSDFFQNNISIRAFRPNPVSPDDRENYLIFNLVPKAVQFAGAGNFSKFALERFKRSKAMQLRCENNRENQLIIGECKKNDLNELFNLLYVYINEPRKDGKAFTEWKANQMEMLNGDEIRASSEFYMDAINAVWYPEVPRLNEQDLQKISMKDIYNSFHKWNKDLNGYTFIITGDFDKDAIEPVLIKKLSAFSGTLPTNVNKKSVNFPLRKMEETIKLKNLDQSFVRLYFPVEVPTDTKTQAILELLSRALGQRVVSRLRVGSYAPGVEGNWIDFPNGIYSFCIRFDCELGNEKTMIDYAMDEFHKLKQEGIDQNWLEKNVLDEVSSYKRRLESFGFFNYWPDYIQETLENNIDPQEKVLKYEAILEHFIKKEDVNKAARKYLDEGHLQKFFIIPENYEMDVHPVR